MSTAAPNWFAYATVLAWPVITLILFRVFPTVQAVLWTVLGAQMFLPELTEFKVEMFPAIDKNSIASICALIGCMVAKQRQSMKGRFGLVGVLLAMYFVGPLVTSYLNGDTLVVGPRVLPGVGLYDGISASIGQALLILPFFLGRRYVADSNSVEAILRVLVVAGLIYSLPMIFEIRMSPQLHQWIYGFSPTNMLTERRFGGFRPVVFMGLGLITAFFTLTSTIAVMALWRSSKSVSTKFGGAVAAYLSTVFLLCKSSGALLYGIVAIPLVRFASARVQMFSALLITSLALTYPIVRYADLFPEHELVQLASSISSDRAYSLQTRFKNEDELLARASERFLFGWGRYGRNRIYSEDTGIDLSLTDGQWILTLGMWGVFGFIAEFGLLALAVFRAASAYKLAKNQERLFIAALALICALTLFEQLPNASIRPWTWLITGALLGRSEALQVQTRFPRRITSMRRGAG